LCARMDRGVMESQTRIKGEGRFAECGRGRAMNRKKKGEIYVERRETARHAVLHLY